MWSLFTGRRGNGNLPQREPLWKRVERLEESVGKLQKTEKDRLEKERMMKEETKTQELLEKMKKRGQGRSHQRSFQSVWDGGPLGCWTFELWESQSQAGPISTASLS